MILFDKNSCIDIFPKNKNKYVALAIEDMRRDFERVSVSGHKPKIVDFETKCCIIIEENTRETAEPLNDEAFSIKSENGRIKILADGYLGTMWGIYTFCERILGVEPCYIFNDYQPEKRESLETGELDICDAPESFGFRGVFLNDEDLLTGWKNHSGIRQMDYRFYCTVPEKAAIARVVETILRLRMNLVIPASFLDIDNPCEKALADAVAERGIYISQHHIEPCGVSSFTFENYCKKYGKSGDFSYLTNRETMEEAWKFYIKKWAQYPNVVWQTGLRGKTDRPIWQEAEPTDDELCSYASFISHAYHTQRDIILRETCGKAKYFTSTLWMEGVHLMNKGFLDIPESTIVVYSDNGPDQMYGPDFYSSKKSPQYNYGIYYHLQYICCGPHLAPQTGLKKLLYNIRLAANSGNTAYFIINLSNTREFTYEIDAASKMLWDEKRFDERLYKDNTTLKFGKNADTAKQLIDDYYNCLPTIPTHILPQQHGKYFTYKTDYAPMGIKIFIAKDGIICEKGEWITARFKKEIRDAVADAMYEPIKRVIPEYERIRDGFAALAKKCDEKSAFHIRTKWLLYSEYLLSLYKWYTNLYEARECYISNDADGMTEKILRGANELESILKKRKIAEYGDFCNWYRGETKLDIAKRYIETLGIIGRTPKLHL